MLTLRSGRGPRSLALVVSLLVVSCSPATDSAHEFALFGDAPYEPASVAKVEALIQDVNSFPGLQWVIHVGDTKHGDQPCSDEFLRGRFDLYQAFALPLVFTPGDNDWFDCVGEAAGGFDDHERLAYLRRLYFPDPARTSGARSMAVRSQALEPDYQEFVENVLWVHGDVVYVTVHLIGLTRSSTDPEAAHRRLDAAIAWIHTAFSLAQEQGKAGVFIATQADPWIAWGVPAVMARMCATCLEPRPGLERLYPALIQESGAFGGQVVLAVGDTHIFRVDKPLYRDDGSLVENFTRVETFGEPNIHWVRVTVNPGARELFSFHQEMVPGNMAGNTPE